MARRRLQAILATTVLTVGLTGGVAAAQEIPGLGELEETVTSTTEEVTSTTEDVVDTITDTVTGPETSSAEPTDDASSEPATEEATPEETASEDDALIDLGTGDGTLDVELDVDVAPSDEDGSPQLEVDGGLTVGGETIDVGGATDPVEEVIDPDPAPSPTGDTSGDQADAPRSDGPGGFFAGGGVVAAGDDTRPATTGSTGSTRSSGGQGFTSFRGSNGGSSFGLQRFGGGTMQLDRVPDPEVAPRAAAPEAMPFEEFPEAPEVAEGRTPAVLATQGPMGGDESPLATILRALAGALVLATGAAWTKVTREA